MRRHAQIFVTAVLFGWVGCCVLSGVAPAFAAKSAPSDSRASNPPVGTFDRTALEKVLSKPLEQLAEEPTEALRAYVGQLGDLHFALELAVDVLPAERRALSERILTRVGQVGLLVRQRTTERHAPGRGRGLLARGADPPPPTNLAGLLVDSSGLLLSLSGGLLIAFALGYLLRDRRAARAADSGGPGDRERESSAPAPAQAEVPSEGRPMTIEQIRAALSSGYAVLLQMGYEISPPRRRRFLALAREAHEILNGVEGQSYSVWEDPGHPNRFYEFLVCRRVEVLDELALAHGPLPKLAEQIEACRVRTGYSFHRAWVGALPDGQVTPRMAPVPEGSLSSQGIA